jgi:hypothetical protein
MDVVLPYVLRMSMGDKLPEWTSLTSWEMGAERIDRCEAVRGPVYCSGSEAKRASRWRCLITLGGECQSGILH